MGSWDGRGSYDGGEGFPWSLYGGESILECFGLGYGHSSFDMDGFMQEKGFIDSSTWIDGLKGGLFKI